MRICILGNISLLPTEIQQLMVEGTKMTKHNDRLLTDDVWILASYICLLCVLYYFAFRHFVISEVYYYISYVVYNFC